MAKLTHIDDDGQARMVDVGDKEVTKRKAVAAGKVLMSPEAALAIKEGTLKKGDTLAVARVAGIQAAKRTSELAPLAHPLPLSHVGVDLEVVEDGVEIRAEASVEARTGVEMEALCAVAGAALCIYDMAKAMDRGMVISEIRLLEKSGGRSGEWVRR
jgi:cyclic pyranopterin phosphate synthase